MKSETLKSIIISLKQSPNFLELTKSINSFRHQYPKLASKLLNHMQSIGMDESKFQSRKYRRLAAYLAKSYDDLSDSDKFKITQIFNNLLSQKFT